MACLPAGRRNFAGLMAIEPFDWLRASVAIKLLGELDHEQSIGPNRTDRK